MRAFGVTADAAACIGRARVTGVHETLLSTSGDCCSLQAAQGYRLIP